MGRVFGREWRRAAEGRIQNMGTASSAEAPNFDYDFHGNPASRVEREIHDERRRTVKHRRTPACTAAW
jgi:hypothetical protein